MSEITTASLAHDAVLLDVREQDEWDAGHAPHAVHIPLGELAARLSELPQVDGPLPIICRSGGRSERARQWLDEQGHDAINVTGGMTSWAADDKPVVASSGAPGQVI